MENEKRLLDAKDVKELITGLSELPWEEEVDFLVDSLPTVDAVEVVHGRWEDFCRGKMCRCSACKAEFDNTCNEIHEEWYYCPNCGVKLDGDGNG